MLLTEGNDPGKLDGEDLPILVGDGKELTPERDDGLLLFADKLPGEELPILIGDGSELIAEPFGD